MSALLILSIVSFVLAAAMGAAAWKLAREESRRSDARVAALAADIHDEKQIGNAVPSDDDSDTSPDPFSRAVVIGALAVVVVAGAFLALRVHGVRAATGGRHTAAPLELVALGQEREGGRLIVRGVVRNPALGVPSGPLTAVVFVFNHSGAFVTSGRAPLEHPTLAPGVESTFVVAVTGADDVDRYRVSFRTDDRIVAHIDRRDHAPASELP